MGIWVVHLLFSIGCGIIAYYKNRNVLAWTIGGFILSVAAFLILIFLPKLNDTVDFNKKDLRSAFKKFKVGVIRKPKKTFKFPGAAFTYEKNAFQILGFHK